ncbi:hypothetical protein AHiyo1_07220 [Arthrobacter sp. Hiyo1]|nr:hypothetical protein AHiyo1_07220 [Arthrobacter sp. Hiyo1]
MRRGDLLSSWTSLRQRTGAPDALVAQGIERLPPEQKAVGSNPIEGTTENPASSRNRRGFSLPHRLPWSLAACQSGNKKWKTASRLAACQHNVLVQTTKRPGQTPQQEPAAAFPELESIAPVLAKKLSRLPAAHLATILCPQPKDTDA